MTGTKKRSDGRYQIRFTIDGKRYSVYGKTQKEAREKAEEKRIAIKEHGIPSNSNITLKKYFEYWITAKKGTVKGITIYDQKTAFSAVLVLIGARRLSKIDRMTVIQVQNKLAESVSAQTANYKINILYSVCKTAVYDGILSQNPCEGVKPLRITKTPARETIHRSLTEDELKSFFKTYAERYGGWYADMFKFLLYTGCRFGEAAALRWSDVDMKNGVLHIVRTATKDADGKRTTGTPKTRTSKRDIPLNAAIISVLKQQKQRLTDRFGKITPILVFVSLKGASVRQDTVYKQIIETCKASGIDNFGMHAFRDTFATMAIRQGMQPNTLKELLGHSSFSMTMDLYAHVLEDQKREEMEKIKITV